MCRLAAYIGPEIRIASLVTEPEHSLIHQSYSARERVEPLNGDGFGVGWYARGISDSPALFKEVNPAWSNANLRHVARVTQSSCIFAHVRAATVGTQLSRYNCHPFAWKNYMFMHNGTIPGFESIKRALRRQLSDEAYSFIQGTTDTEHIFALVTDQLSRQDAPSVSDLADSLISAIGTIEKLKRDSGISEAATLNLVLTDGENMVATRYISAGEDSNSLYYARIGNYSCEEGQTQLDRGRNAVLVVSEPLNESSQWQRIANNQMILVDGQRELTLVDISL